MAVGMSAPTAASTELLIRGAGRGGIVLGIGQVAGRLLGLARNAVIARLVSPEDFGIASTFAIALSVLELMSDLAVDRVVVQDEHGADPDFQGTAQLLLALRGALLAGTLVLIAPHVARLFDAPQATSAFRMLSLVPLLRGLAHLDRVRFQRDLRFAPEVTVDVVGQAASFLVALVAGLALRNYAAMMWAILAQYLAVTATAHIVAERPYRFRIHGRHWRRIARFGAPLVLSSTLVFFAYQGDRLLIGVGNYSLTDLAVYSVAYILASTPAVMLARMASTLILPLLSPHQGQPSQLLGAVRTLGLGMGAIGGLLLGSLVLFGDAATELIYGPGYDAAVGLLPWLAAAQTLRFLRMLLVQMALAVGRTEQPLMANVGKALAVGATIVLALQFGLPLWAIAAGGVAGELLAGVTAVLLLRRALRQPVLPVLMPGIIAVGALGACVMVAFLAGLYRIAPVPRIATGGAIALGLAVFAWRRRDAHRAWIGSVLVGGSPRA